MCNHNNAEQAAALAVLQQGVSVATMPAFIPAGLDQSARARAPLGSAVVGNPTPYSVMAQQATYSLLEVPVVRDCVKFLLDNPGYCGMPTYRLLVQRALVMPEGCQLLGDPRWKDWAAKARSWAPVADADAAPEVKAEKRTALKRAKEGAPPEDFGMRIAFRFVRLLLATMVHNPSPASAEAAHVLAKKMVESLAQGFLDMSRRAPRLPLP